jgi:hypothetical protein
MSVYISIIDYSITYPISIFLLSTYTASKHSNPEKAQPMTKIELSLPDELVTHLDDVRSKLDYKSRDEFMLAALKRLLDRY